MAVSRDLGRPFLGVLAIRALLFGSMTGSLILETPI